MTVGNEPPSTAPEEESVESTTSANEGSEEPSAPAVNSDSDLPDNPDELNAQNMEALLNPGTRLDLSPKGRAASRALLSLSRAARAFLLYDPSNAAVGVFLEAIQENFSTYLKTFGPLSLSVRPFELAVDSEVVYDEEDRERSLAFKLFRDGVRRLTVFEAVEWSELLKLLEILSIRYTGIRLNEDDIVTLLWKANFQHVEIEAVEGFVPEEEDFNEDEFYQQDIQSALKGKGSFNLDGNKKSVEGQDPSGDTGEPGSSLDPAMMAMSQAENVEDGEGFQGEPTSGAQLPQEMSQALGHSQQDDAYGDDSELALGMGTSIVPADMDLPSPKLPVVRQAEWVSVGEEEIEKLLEEDGARALPGDCLVLAEALLVFVESPNEPMLLEEVAPLLTEIRDFMLTEGHLPNLMRLLECVADFAANMSEDQGAQNLVKSFANSHALSRLIRSVPGSSHTPPQEFYDLLDKLPGDHLSTLIDILESERTLGSRRITRQLIEHFIPGNEQLVVKRLRGMVGAVAADLLRCLSNVDQDAAWDVILDFAAGDDVDTQLECLHVLGRAQHTSRVRGYLGRLLSAKDAQVRIKTIALLSEHKKQESFGVLLKHLTSARAVEREEAMALGTAMTMVSLTESMELYRTWIKPKGLFKKLKPVSRSQWQAALAGLVLVDEDEADELLKALSNRADSDTNKLCVQARMRRHRRLRGIENPE